MIRNPLERLPAPLISPSSSVEAELDIEQVGSIDPSSKILTELLSLWAAKKCVRER